MKINKKKIIYIFICILFILIFSFIYSKINNKGIVVDNFTIDISSIDKLINDEIEGLVYFGRDTCPDCLDFNKFLLESVSKYNNISIYKFDTDYWQENDNFEFILKKYDINSIPKLIKINPNREVDIFSIDSSKENIKDIYLIQLKLDEFIKG